MPPDPTDHPPVHAIIDFGADVRAEIAGFVDAGAEFLDTHHPHGQAWVEDVDDATLDLGDPQSCVLGQVANARWHASDDYDGKTNASYANFARAINGRSTIIAKETCLAKMFHLDAISDKSEDWLIEHGFNIDWVGIGRHARDEISGGALDRFSDGDLGIAAIAGVEPEEARRRLWDDKQTDGYWTSTGIAYGLLDDLWKRAITARRELLATS